MQMLISSERVVTPGRVGPGTLEIAHGRIAAIRPGHARGPGVLDCGALAISPGGFDCHVHVNEPGRTAWEGFATATRAAAAGGVTSLVDMPLNCLPVTTTGAALAQKLAAARGQLHVDVGFWGGVIPGNAPHLRDLARGGVLGCKAFLVHSGIDEFPNATADDLRVAMPELARHGLPLLAHAELDLGAPADGGDPRAYASYLASRPAAWEDAAIALLIELCRETGCAVHIVHLSAASSLPQLRAARAEGLPITVETCPHYLCFEAEAIAAGATQFKCAPPIRTRENREALWQALFEGVIDCVISDHSPCTPELKRRERGHFDEAWGGIASLSLALPAIWSEARGRGAQLSDLARWLSEEPARLAGWGARKGRIAVGCDADLVVWDPDASFAVTPERLFFRHKLSPYLGATLHGRVERCFLRGREIFDGAQPADAAHGELLLHRQGGAA